MNIKRIIDKILHRDFYIITDPEDGSVTLSKDLYERMQEDCHQKLDDVYCFAIGDEYGWICNPQDNEQLKGKKIPVAKVQYNGKSKTIGFMPTNPTLAKIYYDYGIGWDTKAKLRVQRFFIPNTFSTYYTIKH